jgi:hypothetical protein
MDIDEKIKDISRRFKKDPFTDKETFIYTLEKYVDDVVRKTTYRFLESRTKKGEYVIKDEDGDTITLKPDVSYLEASKQLGKKHLVREIPEVNLNQKYMVGRSLEKAWKTDYDFLKVLWDKYHDRKLVVDRVTKDLYNNLDYEIKKFREEMYNFINEPLTPREAEKIRSIESRETEIEKLKQEDQGKEDIPRENESAFFDISGTEKGEMGGVPKRTIKWLLWKKWMRPLIIIFMGLFVASLGYFTFSGNKISGNMVLTPSLFLPTIFIFLLAIAAFLILKSSKKK